MRQISSAIIDSVQDIRAVSKACGCCCLETKYWPSVLAIEHEQSLIVNSPPS